MPGAAAHELEAEADDVADAAGGTVLGAAWNELGSTVSGAEVNAFEGEEEDGDEDDAASGGGKRRISCATMSSMWSPSSKETEYRRSSEVASGAPQ